MAKLGYSGTVHATPATIEMASLIIRDSARIQAQDNRRTNRRRRRAGEEPIEPLYTTEDGEAIIEQFRPAPYN